VFTDLVLALMRARAGTGEASANAITEACYALEKLRDCLEEGRIPAVPPVAKFARELEEAAR